MLILCHQRNYRQMATFLFDSIVFGPVQSRRLGLSLGINLLPGTGKLCNFNCIYCECGWTPGFNDKAGRLPSREEVHEALNARLSKLKQINKPPDVITFAGNGEPTLHPEFPEIIDDTIELRNRYVPGAAIAVLSNSTTITVPRIKAALLKIEKNILKLDSAFDLTIRIHNQPRVNVRVQDLIENLKGFKGELLIQTLFIQGTLNGEIIDNTTPRELDAWLKALDIIKPSEVMIYTISRDTPEGGNLRKVPLARLRLIEAMVNQLGIRTRVSA